LAAAAGANPNGGAVALGDGSADFVAARQRVWGAGGNYAFGPATVGLLWTHSQIDNMADVFTAGATGSGYSALNGGLRLDNFEVNARYALTPMLSVAGAYTFTNGSYGDGANSSSPKWNEVTLQTDYALSKRTDVYIEGIYDNVHGGGSSGVMSEAMIGTLTPSSTGTQIAATVGMRHQF